MNHAGKAKLPAYAKPLAEARARGLVPRKLGFGQVAVVLSWNNRATAGLHRVVVPPDADLAALDFGCLAGLHVLMPHRQNEATRAAAVVDALLVAGVDRVDAANLDALARGEPLDGAWPVFIGAGHGA